MLDVRLNHFFLSFHSVGGAEAILKHHCAHDSNWRLNSQFVIYFEAPDRASPRIWQLGLRDASTIRTARREFARAMAETRPEIAVYHIMWGMPFLIDLDGVKRRILLLHGEPRGWELQLKVRAPWVDGILCVNDLLRRRVQRLLPYFPEDRLEVLSTPVSPPARPAERPPFSSRAIRIAYSGRLIKEYKRVDRLPLLAEALRRHGIEFQLEILGDGPERSWLELLMPDRSEVRFHGFKSGAGYWETLGACDFVVFTSDTEGLPVSLLEAMSIGVMPLFPEIGSGGDQYARSAHPDFLYPPGAFDELAERVRRLVQLPEARIDALRARCRDAVADHVRNAYMDQFAGFIRRNQELPRLSTGRIPRRPFPLDYLPYTWLDRIGSVRRLALRVLRR